MRTTSLRLSRRAWLSGAVSAGFVSAAQGAQRLSEPPPLQTIRSQFIQLEPLMRVPELSLERIDGKRVALKDFLGKVVLLSFWASWCPPCRRELPRLERLQRAASALPLEVVAVSIDHGGRAVVAPFLQRLKVRSLHPFLDPDGKIAKVIGSDSTAPFVLWGMPISYVLDREGRAIGYITGDVDWTSREAMALLEYYARN